MRAFSAACSGPCCAEVVGRACGLFRFAVPMTVLEHRSSLEALGQAEGASQHDKLCRGLSQAQLPPSLAGQAGVFAAHAVCKRPLIGQDVELCRPGLPVARMP